MSDLYKQDDSNHKDYVKLNGEIYYSFLKKFHDFLNPKGYLEIGTATGASLANSRCNSIAIDPMFTVSPDSINNKRPVTMLFSMPSDLFFAEYNPTSLLSKKIDIAFLDGLHEAETLLRDFYNTERHCKRNSIIFLHDMLPFNGEMTIREYPGGAVPWTGDVWKVLPILRKNRPGLDIYVFDAAPTGLVAITNLDPESRELSDNYYKIWKEWSNIELKEYGVARYFDECNIISTSSVNTASKMRKLFWL
ncbi:class I SAM-dependent methyltransferase [Labrys okinawensis]|uniref:class I SAM-dependent methyltransferase n=1 Tax=Labrys okinawensis TaxID=346911 RepID=UPI0011B27C65|nr:class I SAM-dependent methyltransferase [Labrys okinawensis]